MNENFDLTHRLAKEYAEREKEQAQLQILESYKIRGQSIPAYSRKELNENLILLGNRWLERGHGALLVAPSGHGKSTAAYQMSCCWAAALPAFAINTPIVSGMRILIIQSEDSSNDLIEMSRCVHRLGLSQAQLQMVERNTHIETVNDVVGQRFIERADQIFTQWPPDLVILNPVSDYIPGQLVDEAEVKHFLRQQLNPLLSAHACGVLCIHPTPKTNYQGTEHFNWWDWMYWGAGSAEFARWARAGLVIVPTALRGTYRFIAAKRYEKIGWQAPEYWFSHSSEQGIDLWISATSDQQIAAKAKKNLIPDDLLVHISFVDPISQANLEEDTKTKFSHRQRKNFIDILLEQNKIEEIRIPRASGAGRPGIAYRRLV
jgi:AAA domain